MACGTGVHANVAGVAIVPPSGVMICGVPFDAHALDWSTVMVRGADVTGSQPLVKRATTTQLNVPLRSGCVAFVVFVTAASALSIHSSYSAAPVTAVHANVTGELTLARVTGSRSDGGVVEQEVCVAVTFVVAVAALFDAFASDVDDVI